MKRTLFWLWMLLLVSVNSITLTHAQETAVHPLAALIAMLPAPTDEMLGSNEDGFRRIAVSYVDLETLRSRFPNDPIFSRDSLIGALAGSGSSEIVGVFEAELEDMESAIGISLDSIHRMMAYGDAPARLILLQGEFDGDAVRAGFTAGEFAVDTSDRLVTRMCHPDGCDNAAMIEFSLVNRGNPFGGRVGRREAVALIESDLPGDDLLLATAYAPLFEATIARITGEQDAFAFLPSDLADVLIDASGENALVAATIYPAEVLSGSVAANSFDMFGIAALITPDDSIETVVTAYSGNGKVPALSEAVLNARLDEESASAPRTYRSMLDAQGVSIDGVEIVTAGETGSALLLRLSSEGAASYSLPLRMVMNRDMGWLAQ